jgi:hypothetical protein
MDHERDGYHGAMDGGRRRAGMANSSYARFLWKHRELHTLVKYRDGRQGNLGFQRIEPFTRAPVRLDRSELDCSTLRPIHDRSLQLESCLLGILGKHSDGVERQRLQVHSNELQCLIEYVMRHGDDITPTVIGLQQIQNLSNARP